MRRRGRWAAALGAAAALAAGAACSGGGPTQSQQPAGMRVLFVGNSLTAAHALPEIVEAFAAAAGEGRLETRTIAPGGWSLEDHWNGGSARAAVGEGGWDVVVLQQGPSALPESRALLVEYAGRFAGEIRAAGGKPALYAVWPSIDRAFDRDAVRDSYAAAAIRADAMLFPAGEAWRAAWARDAGIPLYGADGLHPTPAGSYLAALVVFRGLYGRTPVGLPSTLDLPSGSRLIVDPADAAVLQAAAEEAGAAHGR